MGCSGMQGNQCSGMKKEGDSCQSGTKCADGKCGQCDACKGGMGSNCQGESEGKSCEGKM